MKKFKLIEKRGNVVYVVGHGSFEECQDVKNLMIEYQEEDILLNPGKETWVLNDTPYIWKVVPA